MTQRTLLALSALALAGCAGTLPCNFACTPAMFEAQQTLTVEPVRYAEIFGREWVAGVSIEGETVTQHYPAREARR